MPKKAAKKVVVQMTAAKPKKKKNRSRRKKQNRSDCVEKFAKCVLLPGASAAKVPDASCHSVVVEYKTSFSGTPGDNGILAVSCFPGLPCAGYATYGKFTLPNRQSVASSITSSGSGIIMVPFPDFVSDANSAVSGTVVTYNRGSRIKSARCVAYKMEVVPIGALLQQGGSAVTARIPVDVYPSFMAQLQNCTSFAGTALSGDAAQPVLYSNSSILNGYFGQSLVAAYPNSRLCSGTESCVLMGMPDDYQFIPALPEVRDNHANMTYDTMPLLYRITTNSNPGGAGPPVVLPVAGGGTFDNDFAAMLPSNAADRVLFGNFWYQNKGEALIWFGSGLPLAQSYEFRITCCMELCVDSESTYRPFISEPAPSQPQVVEKVKKVMAALPPSLPKATSDAGWWSTVTSAATGIADTVSSLGIPVVSGIASGAMKVAKLFGMG